MRSTVNREPHTLNPTASKPLNPRSPNYRPLPLGSEAGSYLRLIDFVYHSLLGLRVIKKKKKKKPLTPPVGGCRGGAWPTSDTGVPRS